MKRIFFLALALISILPASLFSQELNCKVAVNNIESIQSPQRDYLRNFANDVERYMNSTRFTNEDLDGEKIDCNIEITIISGSSSNRYKAKTFIASQRPVYIGDDLSDRTTPILRINDDSWDFTYMPNQRMNHDEMIFDPLTGFLDFYAYLIIGYDLETYLPMSGNNCFQKAINVVRIAANSSESNDWKQSSASYSKFGISDELNNMKYDSFRSSFNNYHFDGIDLLTSEQIKAQDNILNALESINEIQVRQGRGSVVIKQFFDAKSREIAEVFRNYPDRGIYDKLSTFDEEHRRIYQEVKDKL
ncbi:MAG: DUF4835 family protein [Bacteroidetes bacterium]|nr:DUF4835 family protein [Bacteroidota bacterium]